MFLSIGEAYSRVQTPVDELSAYHHTVQPNQGKPPCPDCTQNYHDWWQGIQLNLFCLLRRLFI